MPLGGTDPGVIVSVYKVVSNCVYCNISYGQFVNAVFVLCWDMNMKSEQRANVKLCVKLGKSDMKILEKLCRSVAMSHTQ